MSQDTLAFACSELLQPRDDVISAPLAQELEEGELVDEPPHTLPSEPAGRGTASLRGRG